MLIFATALSLAACASSDDTSNVSIRADQAVRDKARQATTVTVRLAVPPDPVWEWLKNSGTLEEWEYEANIDIQDSSPFDQFTAFAGGHSDIAVIDALRAPQLIAQSEHKPVIIGKITHDRSFLAVSSAYAAEDIGDLRKKKIAIDNSLASAPLWGLIAHAANNFTFSTDSSDYDLMTVEPSSLADLVARGDVDACVCLPEAAATILADAAGQNSLVPLYNGRTAAEIYAADIRAEPLNLPIAKVLVANEVWYADHAEEVKKLLDLWNKGLSNWTEKKEQVIADYPHLFSVDDEQEINWIANYASEHDWYSASSYITPKDVEVYKDTIARMRDSGLLSADAAETPLMIVHHQELAESGEVEKP